MCWAIRELFHVGHITEEEYKITTNEINSYIKQVKFITQDYECPVDTLTNALKLCELPRSFENTLSIYKDWANRPALIQVHTEYK